MRGWLRFFTKELAEIARTWRLPVLGGFLLFFALSGPVLAQLTPALLESMTTSQPGVVIQVPDPTWRDAYAQWVKNLSQMGSFLIVIMAAGTVAGEVAGGTAALVLTKPVSRSAFVVAKAVALEAVLVGAVAAGTAITQAVTLGVFGRAPGADLWLATAVWLAFASVLVSVAVALSTVLPTLAAAGVGVAVFFALSAITLWEPAVKYSPAGLLGAPGQLVAGGDVAVGWPLAAALVLSVLLVALGAVAFARREL